MKLACALVLLVAGCGRDALLSFAQDGDQGTGASPDAGAVAATGGSTGVVGGSGGSIGGNGGSGGSLGGSGGSGGSIGGSGGAAGGAGAGGFADAAIAPPPPPFPPPILDAAPPSPPVPDAAAAACPLPSCLASLVAACPTIGACVSQQTGGGGSNQCYADGVTVHSTLIPTTAAVVTRADGSTCYRLERSMMGRGGGRGGGGGMQLSYVDASGAVVATGVLQNGNSQLAVTCASGSQSPASVPLACAPAVGSLLGGLRPGSGGCTATMNGCP